MTPDGLIDLAALIVCVVAAFVAGFAMGFVQGERHERGKRA